MNNFYKGGRELAYLKGLSHYAVQQEITAIRQHVQMQVHAAILANAIMFIDPITLLRKLWKSKAILLIGIALLHMFSLSAQTPRKDSGADGLTTALRVGDQVPPDFWSKKMTIYHDGDTVQADLSQYRGKFLLLDFWATWCGYCVFNLDTVNTINNNMAKGRYMILPVNSLRTQDTYLQIDKIFSGKGQFIRHKLELPTVVFDEYLYALFPHLAVPHYVWIDPRGWIHAITQSDLVNPLHIENLMNSKNQ